MVIKQIIIWLDPNLPFLWQSLSEPIVYYGVVFAGNWKHTLVSGKNDINQSRDYGALQPQMLLLKMQSHDLGGFRDGCWNWILSNFFGGSGSIRTLIISRGLPVHSTDDCWMLCTGLPMHRQWLLMLKVLDNSINAPYLVHSKTESSMPEEVLCADTLYSPRFMAHHLTFEWFLEIRVCSEHFPHD